MSTNYPTVRAEEIAWLTTDQMIEVDRVMIEDLGIQLFQMMENAGRNLALLAMNRYSPAAPVVAVGPGGNGGGGMVAARHLAVAGENVRVVLGAGRDQMAPVPAAQLAILDEMGVPVLGEVPADADLFIDAVLGYSLQGAPRGLAGEVISAISATSIPTLSLDTPSGLDTASGEAADPHIDADATMTLALPKVGLASHSAVGKLFLANISVPNSVYENMGALPGANFHGGYIVEVLR